MKFSEKKSQKKIEIKNRLPKEILVPNQPNYLLWNQNEVQHEIFLHYNVFTLGQTTSWECRYVLKNYWASQSNNLNLLIHDFLFWFGIYFWAVENLGFSHHVSVVRGLMP